MSAMVIQVAQFDYLFTIGLKMSFEGFKEQDPTFATRAIHVAQDPEQWDAMPVVCPISLATTFKQDAPAEFRVAINLFHLNLFIIINLDIVCLFIDL